MKSSLNLVLHDIHYPKIHKPTINCVLDFLSKNKVDSFTFGGDQLDFESIAHHNKGKGLYKLPGSYAKDVEGFDREILTPIEKLLSKDTKRIYHMGNHERFEHDNIEEHPELQGTIDHVKNLRIRERGWKVIPLGHCSKLGKLTVIHGETLSGIGNQAGTYPSKKAVELYGTSVLAGHTHAPQSYTRIAPVEKVQKNMGWIAPCACTVNPSYLRNRATAWMPGFTIVEILPNRNFNLYPVIVSGNQCSFGGEIYGK